MTIKAKHQLTHFTEQIFGDLNRRMVYTGQHDVQLNPIRISTSNTRSTQCVVNLLCQIRDFRHKRTIGCRDTNKQRASDAENQLVCLCNDTHLIATTHVCSEVGRVCTQAGVPLACVAVRISSMDTRTGSMSIDPLSMSFSSE